MKELLLFICVMLLCNITIAQSYLAEDYKIFNAKEGETTIPKKVILFKDATKVQKIIFFRTRLQVNTDGTPKSYHPEDIGGNNIAINTIGNGVAIYKNGYVDIRKKKINLFIDGPANYKLGKEVFKQFQESNYEKVTGYEILWENVLYPVDVNGILKPCVLSEGEYKGYYGSMTKLKNGLKEHAEDCGCSNQINSLEVNGFVIPLGKNALKKFGSEVGDLVLAYNPKNNKLVYAVIYDEGPQDKLGEGSVSLNMNLENKTKFPENSNQTNSFATKNKIYLIILPNSKNYKIEKTPYSNTNIEQRAKSLLAEIGYKSDKAIIEFILSNSSKL